MDRRWKRQREIHRWRNKQPKQGDWRKLKVRAPWWGQEVVRPLWVADGGGITGGHWVEIPLNGEEIRQLEQKYGGIFVADRAYNRIMDKLCQDWKAKHGADPTWWPPDKSYNEADYYICKVKIDRQMQMWLRLYFKKTRMQFAIGEVVK